ncbi:PucR family transcriptional regulator [Patulibacter americanus]|uniref:PucR family transcriptional regulator n=1 Tax=Patulibacter americanus TaxID=588672 RepID=UPI0003B56D24|nr:helix-turn-helix domain-containing protein [Patulibacter americanus]
MTTRPGTGPEPPLAPLLERIAAELEADLDAVTDAMDAAAVELVPVLGRDPAILADVHASHRGNLVRWLAVIRRGEEPGPAHVPPEALDVARTIVRRGLEVDAILHAYRSGQRVAWGAWMERAYRVVPPGPELVRVLEVSLDLLFRFVDLVLDRVLEEVRSAEEEVAGGAQRRRAQTVGLLLDGAPVDAPTVSARLGYELARRHTAVVLWTSDAAASTALEPVAALLGRAAGARRPLTLPVGTTTTWAWLGTDAVPDPDALRDAFAAAHPDVRAAVGPSLPGAAGFRASHEAAVAVHALLADAPADGRLVHHDELAVTVLAGQDRGRAEAFVHATLGPLAADDPASARLRETLRVFLDEAEHAPRTAARLFLHRNTVLQRVARATEVLGFAPGERRLEVALALELQRWLGPGRAQR